jgi:DNA-directed RNA polymerase subunit M/transcription elongation factor TFIIS
MKITNPITFRQNVIDKLADVIGDRCVTMNIERGIFNYAVKEATSKKIIKKWENPLFAQIYLDRLRSLHINLKNPQFVEQIINGDLAPETIASLTHQEMNPERWKVLIDRKMKRDETKYTHGIEASTTEYTCKKCKGNKCTHYEMQTRSADEPTTVFVTCLTCGKNWKC